MQQSGYNVLQMCKIHGEIKAESLIARVAPAAVWSRYAVGAVRITCYWDHVRKQAGDFLLDKRVDLLNLRFDGFARLSLLGMYAATVQNQGQFSCLTVQNQGQFLTWTPFIHSYIHRWNEVPLSSRFKSLTKCSVLIEIVIIYLGFFYVVVLCVWWFVFRWFSAYIFWFVLVFSSRLWFWFLSVLANRLAGKSIPEMT